MVTDSGEVNKWKGKSLPEIKVEDLPAICSANTDDDNQDADNNLHLRKDILVLATTSIEEKPAIQNTQYEKSLVSYATDGLLPTIYITHSYTDDRDMTPYWQVGLQYNITNVAIANSVDDKQNVGHRLGEVTIATYTEDPLNGECRLYADFYLENWDVPSERLNVIRNLFRHRRQVEDARSRNARRRQNKAMRLGNQRRKTNPKRRQKILSLNRDADNLKY